MVSEKQRLVKVRANSPWTAICRDCGDKVVWAETVNEPRWLLFDATVLLVTEQRLEDGVPVSCFPVSAVHWTHCRDRRVGESPGDEARGRGARA